MSDLQVADLLAIDVGSSRIKLGWFPRTGDCPSEPKPNELPIAAPRLPRPDETWAVAHGGRFSDSAATDMVRWLEKVDAEVSSIYVASVHPIATEGLLGFLRKHLEIAPRCLTVDDLSIDVRVEQPERVGIDRLLSALAANELRRTDEGAIVVDLGTATTVDLIAADGGFEGGAISSGLATSAAGLHATISALPDLTEETFETPPKAIGKSTHDAIAVGLYWGAVGAIRELVDRMSATCDHRPRLLFTGGDARWVVEQFAEARHVPHLVLSGIALAAKGRL